jgi:hypothetical protein
MLPPLRLAQAWQQFTASLSDPTMTTHRDALERARTHVGHALAAAVIAYHNRGNPPP